MSTKILTGPQTKHNLNLDAPIDRWDEAIPLGNGLMGALLWGEDHALKISLDRGDLWDLRVPDTFKEPDWNWQTLTQLAGKGDMPELARLFETPYSELSYPTKLPGGRIELTLDEPSVAQCFSLDLQKATGHVQLTQGHVEVFCHAENPVGFIRVMQTHAVAKLVAPLFGEDIGQSDANNVSPTSLANLGYPPPEYGSDGDTQWYLQKAADNFAFAVIISSKQSTDQTLFAFTVTTSKDAADPVALGRQRVQESLDAQFEQIQQQHIQWWKQFWSVSAIEIPDLDIEQHYYLMQYFYGSASRRGAPPMPLQGVWTADEGILPPWKGDYHHDLNTELCYWAYTTAGHMDEGLCFLDFMWELMPTFRDYASNFMGTPGACVPSVMALDGKQMGGWHQYSFSPTNGAWVAHLFYRHWRYTMDEDFLRDRAYPFCREIAACLEAILKPDVNGKLKLPLSSSPEIHDNKLEAWLTPNSNYDLALLRWLFGALAEMAEELGDTVAASHERSVLDQLDDLAVCDQKTGGLYGVGALGLSPDEALAESHRHPAHLMAIHPLGLIHIEGSEHDCDIIKKSFHQLDHLGTGLWCGYTFSWMAAMAARCGQPQRALHMLQCYLKACISRNGFHLNGDYKDVGVSLFKYRPFTLEGNFAAAETVHEMLLQSWGGIVRIFPAVPKDWQDMSFENLRAEGAFRVSARREQGKTVWMQIATKREGVLHLRNPFGDGKVQWSLPVKRQPDGDYHFHMNAGQCIEATCDGNGKKEDAKEMACI